MLYIRPYSLKLETHMSTLVMHYAMDGFITFGPKKKRKEKIYMMCKLQGYLYIKKRYLKKVCMYPNNYDFLLMDKHVSIDCVMLID